MLVVYKYEIDLVDTDQDITYMAGKIVHVGEQNRKIKVWVEHGGEDASALPKVRVFGTGEKIPAGYRHLASVSIPPFVWHLYALEDQ